MSIMKFFLRGKKENSTTEPTHNDVNTITCDTVELRDIITKWIQRGGWEFDDFATFVELIGGKTPIKLSKLNKENYSFKCITALNTEVTISLDFSCLELWVRDNKEETKKYIFDNNFDKDKIVPEVTLIEKIITSGEKSLRCCYSEFSCYRTLKLDETHTLEITVYEPDMFNEKSEVSVLRNCETIEEYLLSLNNYSLNVANVYDSLIKFLGFSKNDITNCKLISINHTEKVNKEIERNKVTITHGKMQEFAITEKGKTYHLFKNGNWKYLSEDGIQIVYLAKNKHYDFSIAGTGSENQIMITNPAEIVNRVKLKISELWNQNFKK